MNWNLAIRTTSFAFLFFGIACVTVNVNFPEGAVQNAADSYVEELYQEKQEAKEKEVKKEATWSLISVAHAEEEFKINTPQAKKISRKLKENILEELKFKELGYLGETNDGHLAIVKDAKIPLKDRKKVKTLMKTQNELRGQLYRHIQEEHGFGPTGYAKIKKSFSKSFQKEKSAPRGTFVQKESGVWSKK